MASQTGKYLQQVILMLYIRIYLFYFLHVSCHTQNYFSCKREASIMLGGKLRKTPGQQEVAGLISAKLVRYSPTPEYSDRSDKLASIAGCTLASFLL